VLSVDTLAVLAAVAFALLVAGDWWARHRDWDLRERIMEIAVACERWNEPLGDRLDRLRATTAARQHRRERALGALADAVRARHDVQLHRHFTIGPPQVVLTYGGHRLKIRLYNPTVWRLNARYQVKLLALDPDDSVGWRFAVYSPQLGNVAQLAWLVTAG
jgi:hypothetical protein